MQRIETAADVLDHLCMFYVEIFPQNVCTTDAHGVIVFVGWSGFVREQGAASQTTVLGTGFH